MICICHLGGGIRFDSPFDEAKDSLDGEGGRWGLKEVDPAREGLGQSAPHAVKLKKRPKLKNDVKVNTVKINAVKTNDVKVNTVKINAVKTNDVKVNTVKKNAVKTNDVKVNTVKTNAAKKK
jgi:hypothetical protein